MSIRLRFLSHSFYMDKKMDKKETPLHVLSGDEQEPVLMKESPCTHRQRRRAHWDRLWLTDPEQAVRASEWVQGEVEKQRMASIWSLLQLCAPYTDKRIVDLGCGAGVLTLRLQQAGAKVDAVDLSKCALRRLEEQQAASAHPIRTVRAYVPYTELEDAAYDLVLCSGLMGELSREEQRVLIAEVYRLVHPDGRILLATSMDTTTDGALEKWHHLLETELEIIEEQRLYHAYFLALLRMGKKLPKVLQGIFTRLEQSGFGLNWLAKRCQAIRGARGVSHVASLARRKALQRSGEVAETPLGVREQRLKRRIWE